MISKDEHTTNNFDAAAVTSFAIALGILVTGPETHVVGPVICGFAFMLASYVHRRDQKKEAEQKKQKKKTKVSV